MAVQSHVNANLAVKWRQNNESLDTFVTRQYLFKKKLFLFEIGQLKNYSLVVLSLSHFGQLLCV